MNEHENENENENENGVAAFLELAGHVGSVRGLGTLYNYVCKSNNTLAAMDGKQFLMLIETALESVEDGVYELATSKAYQKLAKKSALSTAEFSATSFLMSLDFLSAMPITKSQAEKMLVAYTFASTDDTRPYMEGVHFDSPYAVATDGKQLYATLGFDGFPAVTLPRTRLIDIMLKKGVNIRFMMHGEYAAFRFDWRDSTFLYVVKAIDGQFLNWRRVVPAGHTKLLNLCVDGKQPVRKLAAPSVAEWRTIHAVYRKLGKEVRDYAKISIRPKEQSVVEVRNEYDDMVLDIMTWNGFKNDAVDEQHNALCINEEFFNHALTVLPVESITHTDWLHAIVFNYADDSFAIVMPCSR